MTEPNVTAETSPSEPWAEIAAELRRIADDVEKLIGQPEPGLFSVDIQPYEAVVHPPVVKDRAATMSATDAVASALLGKAATTQAMSNGTFHHTTGGKRGRISLSIYQAIADPSAVDPEEEISRLRAENARLRAAAALTPDAGFQFSREQGPEDGVLTHQVPPTDPDDLPADPVGRAVSMARAWGAATPEDAARLLRAWDHRPKLTDAEIASVLDVLFPS